MSAVLCALVGLLTGAALNLWVDHPSRARPLWAGPSCPFCGRPRPRLAWISAIAFLCFKAECSSCGAPISWRYPTVELGLAALFAILWLRDGPPTLVITQSLYAAILVLIAAFDLEHRRIPSGIIVPAWIIALLGSMTAPQPGSAIVAIMGGTTGFLILFLVYLGGRLFVQIAGRLHGAKIDQVAFGQGDIRLGVLIGLILGTPQVLVALLLAFLLGGIVALCWYIRAVINRGSGFTPFSTMAYAPYLTAGALITMIFHPELLSWINSG